MYVPSKFKVTDEEKIYSFIGKNPFGLLLTINGEQINDTHTPFIVGDDGWLFGHIAKANPQWKNWGEATTAKVIFSGPHAYISPKFYASNFNVPTWNYTAVSVSGELCMLTDQDEVLRFIESLVSQHEGEVGWKLDEFDPEYMKLLDALVVFKVKVETIDASFKMNQNKSEQDQQSVAQSLNHTGCPFDAQVAEVMCENLQASDFS